MEGPVLVYTSTAQSLGLGVAKEFRYLRVYGLGF